MMRTISEPDWKLFSQLRPLALDRYCQRVLSDIEGLAHDGARTAHERYLAIYEVVQERNSELAGAFDGARRSRAIDQLAQMQALNLLTEDEMARFSPDTRDVVRYLTGR